MPRSQSPRRYITASVTQSTSSPTPSRSAIARARSSWIPRGSPFLLAAGSAFGGAQTEITPRWRIASRAAGRQRERPRRAAPRPGAWLLVRHPSAARALGLQVADVVDDGLEVVGAQHAPEGRHLAGLAGRDPVHDVVVALVGPHELRALAGLAPALLVAPAADVGEEAGHLLVVVQPDVRAGLQHGERQRDDARPCCPSDGSRPAHPSSLLLERARREPKLPPRPRASRR